MTLKAGLDLLAGRTPTVLILGSFPSEESLRVAQYYANPRNQFWRLVEAVAGIGSNHPYPERVRNLKQRRIALWDVLHSCERDGSLDANIKRGTVAVNDLCKLLKQRPSIKFVGLNGGTAAEIFDRFFADLRSRDVLIMTLPSSSSAHAVKIERKIEAWRVLAEFIPHATDSQSRWLRENRAGFDDYNARVEKHGTLSDALKSMRRKVDAELALLNGPSAGRKLRAAIRAPVRLGGKVKAGHVGHSQTRRKAPRSE